ncbi:nitrate- and nitrite sensing domain-containing protein [Nocardia sp. NPDC050378]|uniref:sensor histidine kinase n=1 Tax=Nocardia sp. NPDC050378 TaxID=3155400 RepID=UPI0033C8656F
MAITLIPSLTLLAIGVGTAGYLVQSQSKAEEWAQQYQSLVPVAREFMEAAQAERQLTLDVMSGGEGNALVAARLRLDKGLEDMVTVSAGGGDGNRLGAVDQTILEFSSGLTRARGGVDSRRLSVADAYAFYNGFVDGLAGGQRVLAQGAPTAVAQTAPTTDIGTRLADGMRIFRMQEAMSRSTALVGVVTAASGTAAIPIAEFVRLVNFYHTEADNLSTDLSGTQQASLKNLMSSPAWQRLTAMEIALVQWGTGSSNTESSSSSGAASRSQPPPSSTDEWRTASTAVTRSLFDVWVTQSLDAQQSAEKQSADNTRNAMWAGGGVATVSILAFLIALLLANRIINRLVRLRRETIAISEVQLPDMMRRLSAGEPVEAEAESPSLDFGNDEIGQVATAFHQAHAAAVVGAVNEARTREGVKAVFLNIAHRSQVIAHRQLEILDKAEERQEDPAILETLFRLDHLATRERRNAENLIILGGGRPGRQWRNPVPLLDVVRSAIGETLDYSRVRSAALPGTHVLGAAVADLIHLLAELVDNATSFSPPESHVEVRGSVVGKGVVIEINDQGMGMPSDTMAQFNEMLAQPPGFGVAALSADSRMGLFVVAQLAARHDVSVRLSGSDYGGIRAIVLLPTALLAPETPRAAGMDSEPVAVERRPRRAASTDWAPVTVAETEPPAGNPESVGFRTEPVTFGAPPMGFDPPPAAVPAVDREPPTSSQSGFDAPAQPTGSASKPALPRRQRQASLTPELAQSATPAESATEPRPQRERTPEQARDLISAIESGTRQGRHVVPE